MEEWEALERWRMRDIEWAQRWLGAPLLAFVERKEAIDNDEEWPQRHDWVLDLVREDDVERAAKVARDDDAEFAQAINTMPTAQLTFSSGGGSSETAEIQESGWGRVWLGDDLPRATLYRDLSGNDAFPTGMRWEGSPATDLKKLLETTCCLDDAPEAEDDDLFRVLEGIRPVDVVAVNVGQGNCNAVFVEHEDHPVLYFDVGAGCLANGRTRPPDMRLCFTGRPNIVLSHWDFDHWYGGSISADQWAARPLWLAPKQPIGVRTRQFVARLLAENRLVAWRSRYSRFVDGFIEIARCIGKLSDKNNSGLAMSVTLPAGPIVCPADATFDHVPPLQLAPEHRALGLVASHHGSTHIGEPIPLPVPGAKLAFSYGAGNTYAHPTGSRARYTAAGWEMQRDTPRGNISLGTDPRRTMHPGRWCCVRPTQ